MNERMNERKWNLCSLERRVQVLLRIATVRFNTHIHSVAVLPSGIR